MASRAFAALALVASCAAAPLGRKWRSLPASAKQLYTYEDFNAEHGKTRSSTAQAVFEANLAEIHAHNTRNESWTAGVNQFTDMTGEEFKSFYQGYVANMPTPIPSSPATPEILNAKLEDLADSVDWRTQKGPKGGPVLSAVKNQGGCGSCWAFSATESVESDIAIETGTMLDLAPQQFVDCVPNPQQCGGTGGCQGATAELAFAYMIKKDPTVNPHGGQEAEANYKYEGKTDTCKMAKLPAPKAQITKYTKLPINDYKSLLAAVGTQPVSISVDASRWSSYEKGVYTGCPHGTTATVDIDHAVQMVGYGTDAGTPYFIVRNSWGPTWGEEGFIRIDRTGAAAGACYMDDTPGDGNGCKGGPKTMKVCGACGILSDSSYPTGGHVVSGGN